jgi:hypothetical protein
MDHTQLYLYLLQHENFAGLECIFILEMVTRMYGFGSQVREVRRYEYKELFEGRVTDLTLFLSSSFTSY